MQDLPAVQVLSVSGRPTRTQKTIYDIALSDGQTYTTFDGVLAAKAQGLQGQIVSARVDVKQNGQYVNYNLLDIAPQGQLAAMAMPAPGGTAVPIGAPFGAPIPMQTAPQGGGGRGFSEADKIRVTKLAVLGTSFDFVGQLFTGAGPEGLEEAVNLAETLAKRLYEQARSHEGVTPVVEQPTPATVAEAVNAEAGAEVVQTGATIPW